MYRVSIEFIETRVEVWENEKCCGNMSRRRVFPQLLRNILIVLQQHAFCALFKRKIKLSLNEKRNPFHLNQKVPGISNRTLDFG